MQEVVTATRSCPDQQGEILRLLLRIFFDSLHVCRKRYDLNLRKGTNIKKIPLVEWREICAELGFCDNFHRTMILSSKVWSLTPEELVDMFNRWDAESADKHMRDTQADCYASAHGSIKYTYVPDYID